MAAPSSCPVCGTDTSGFDALARHLVAKAEESDVAHVMWLNRNVTKHRAGAARLAVLLREQWNGRSTGEDRVAR